MERWGASDPRGAPAAKALRTSEVAVKLIFIGIGVALGVVIVALLVALTLIVIGVGLAVGALITAVVLALGVVIAALLTSIALIAGTVGLSRLIRT
jgi:hypothetical protein